MKREMERIAASLRAAGLEFDPAAKLPEAEAAPSVLFFSGGSALREVSAELAALTHNSVHVVTTFDSGGSSAEVRRAFNMPAPGDLRLRMSSLSDPADSGARAAARFFERRLPPDAEQATLIAELEQLASGKHPWLEGVEGDARDILAGSLDSFLRLMPEDFNLRGAALGNLALAADYLLNGKSLSGSVRRFSRLLADRGRILPVSEDSVHLGVRLKNGEILTGQHRFTGKPGACDTTGVLPSSIEEMFFYHTANADNAPSGIVYDSCQAAYGKLACRPKAFAEVLDEIERCQVVCYPLGSFYSSLLANLRVDGVGEAVRKSRALKIYIPNPGVDPESVGLPLKERIELICQAVAGDKKNKGVLDCLLLDASNQFDPALDGWLKDCGIRPIRYAYTEKNAAGKIIANSDKLAVFLFCLSTLK